MGLFKAKQDRVKPDPDGLHSGRQLAIHLTLAGGVALLCAALVLLQYAGAARTRETVQAIALSGTQEMLIQRIALFSGTLMNAPAPGVETELALAVATFDQNHRALSAIAGGLAGPTHVYFESGAVSVQAQSKRFMSLTHDILDNPRATSNPALREVQHMASATFQGQAAEATKAFAQVARDQTSTQTYWQTLLIAAVVLVMMAETAFVIWPARAAFSRAVRHRPERSGPGAGRDAPDRSAIRPRHAARRADRAFEPVVTVAASGFTRCRRRTGRQAAWRHLRRPRPVSRHQRMLWPRHRRCDPVAGR